MPTYILLSTLTDEGHGDLEVQARAAQEGQRRTQSSWAPRSKSRCPPRCGPYDFVNIVEAPDERRHRTTCPSSCPHAAVFVSLTLPAVPIDDFIESLK